MIVNAIDILRAFDKQPVFELAALADHVGVSRHDDMFNAELRRLVVEKCLARIREGDGILRYRVINPSALADIPKVPVRKRVRLLLEANDTDFSNAQICAALGDDVDSVQVTGALNNLRQLGEVVRVGERGGARWMHAGHVKTRAVA